MDFEFDYFVCPRRRGIAMATGGSIGAEIQASIDVLVPLLHLPRLKWTGSGGGGKDTNLHIKDTTNSTGMAKKLRSRPRIRPTVRYGQRNYGQGQGYIPDPAHYSRFRATEAAPERPAWRQRRKPVPKY